MFGAAIFLRLVLLSSQVAKHLTAIAPIKASEFASILSVMESRTKRWGAPLRVELSNGE